MILNLYKLTAISLAACGAMLPGLTGATERSINAGIEESFGYWRGNNQYSSSESILQTKLAAKLNKVSGKLYMSIADSNMRYNSATRNDLHITTLLDSIATLAYTGKTGSSIYRLGMDTNIPTGTSTLNADRLEAINTDRVVDSLNKVTTWGQGWNLAPHASYTQPLGRSVLAAALRYDLTGTFDPSSDSADDEINPNDIITLYTGISRRGSRISGGLDLIGQVHGKTRQNGTEVYKQGHRLTGNLHIAHKAGPYRLNYAVSYSMQTRNQSMQDAELVTELYNTNNNRVQLNLAASRRLNSRLLVKPEVGTHITTANQYTAGSPAYDAGYHMGYGKIRLNYQADSQLLWHSDIMAYLTRNRADSLEPEDTSYLGFRIGFGVRFNTRL